jgi:predicted transcriptional regulator
MPTTTSLKLPDHLKDKVAALAPGVAQTPHAYMVEAIAERVARDEKRRDLLLAAEKSAAHFKRTGIVYGHEDARRWFVATAQGKPAPKPKARKVPRSER